ncbi:MAG: helix-turn-helix domain-containing protein [Lentisphaeria bacterium]
MIKVLAKAFAVYEEVARKSTVRPVRCSEIAEACQIAPATVMRLLQTLVRLKYLRQVSRQAGYTIGPKAHSLAWHTYYKSPLLKIAAPLIIEFANCNQCSIALCERVGLEYFILCHENKSEKLNIRWERISYRDFLGTAVGMFFSAYASPDEQQQIFAEKLGDYRRFFPQETDCLKCFEGIKKNNFFFFEEYPIAILSFGIFKDQKLVGCLGVTIELDKFQSRKKELIAEIEMLALQIEQTISVVDAIS